MRYSASFGAVNACARCGSERQRVIDGDFDDARRDPRLLSAADHASLVYDDPAAAAPFCALFLTDGVNAGERVVAGVQDDLQAAISELISDDVASAIEWQTPHSIYGDFDADRVADSYDALIGGEPRTTRILAGPDRQSMEGVPPDDLARYEAMAHAIITDHGAVVVCLYDAGSLRPELMDVCARRHGLHVENGEARRNERFEYLPA